MSRFGCRRRNFFSYRADFNGSTSGLFDSLAIGKVNAKYEIEEKERLRRVEFGDKYDEITRKENLKLGNIISMTIVVILYMLPYYAIFSILHFISTGRFSIFN